MHHPIVDLNSHLNQTKLVGSPADFALKFTNALYTNPLTGIVQSVPGRKVITRADTGLALSVVSDRYALVPHMEVLETIERAFAGLAVGPVPRGIYMERGGAKMRAIYKFPALERSLKVNALDRTTDLLCPVIKVTNSLDGTSKISIEIGCFSFVCTNFAVGGSGVFAGGFLAVHSGTISMDAVGDQLRGFLTGFDRILDLLAHWSQMGLTEGQHKQALAKLPPRYADRLLDMRSSHSSVFDVYNDATNLCTHQLRSAPRALLLLAEVNRGFQSVAEWMPKGEVIEAEAVLVG